MVFNPEGSVRLDTPPACDLVSRQGRKIHDLSIPTNLKKLTPESLSLEPN
jgi:hypothetical protein